MPVAPGCPSETMQYVPFGFGWFHGYLVGSSCPGPGVQQAVVSRARGITVEARISPGFSARDHAKSLNPQHLAYCFNVNPTFTVT